MEKNNIPSPCGVFNTPHVRMVYTSPVDLPSFNANTCTIDPANYSDRMLRAGNRLIRASEISDDAAVLRPAEVPEAVARLDWHTYCGIPAVVCAGLPSRTELFARLLREAWDRPPQMLSAGNHLPVIEYLMSCLRRPRIACTDSLADSDSGFLPRDLLPADLASRCADLNRMYRKHFK